MVAQYYYPYMYGRNRECSHSRLFSCRSGKIFSGSDVATAPAWKAPGGALARARDSHPRVEEGYRNELRYNYTQIMESFNTATPSTRVMLGLQSTIIYYTIMYFNILLYPYYNGGTCDESFCKAFNLQAAQRGSLN